jgi:hypothetical protein
MVRNGWSCNIYFPAILKPVHGDSFRLEIEAICSPETSFANYRISLCCNLEYLNRELATAGLQTGPVAVLTIQGQRFSIHDAVNGI